MGNYRLNIIQVDSRIQTKHRYLIENNFDLMSNYFFIRYFLYLHFKYYPESFLYPPPSLLPYPPTPTSWPWHSAVLGHKKFDGQLAHLLLHMQLETWALGVLVSSYCCSTYRVADPLSSLGTFSTSFIGDLVLYPMDDCEHPLLYLLDTDKRPSGDSYIRLLSSGSCWHRT